MQTSGAVCPFGLTLASAGESVCSGDIKFVSGGPCSQAVGLQKREVQSLGREGRLEAAFLEVQELLCNERERSAQLGQRLRQVVVQLERAEVRPVTAAASCKTACSFQVRPLSDAMTRCSHCQSALSCLCCGSLTLCVQEELEGAHSSAGAKLQQVQPANGFASEPASEDGAAPPGFARPHLSQVCLSGRGRPA